jgi:hypothetical protein
VPGAVGANSLADWSALPQMRKRRCSPVSGQREDRQASETLPLLILSPSVQRDSGYHFHDSHMPLTDWLLVIYLMDSSKRRISAKEVERMLGVSYETAWNMHHRIGQAMEKEGLKAFLQKLIGVIGVQESEGGGNAGV